MTTKTIPNLLERIDLLKKEQVPDGSIVAYCYESDNVELVLSGKFVEEDTVKLLQPVSKIKGYLNGHSGVILSRYIQGIWRDRPVAIEFLTGMQGG